MLVLSVTLFVGGGVTPVTLLTVMLAIVHCILVWTRWVRNRDLHNSEIWKFTKAIAFILRWSTEFGWTLSSFLSSKNTTGFICRLAPVKVESWKKIAHST